MQSRRLWKRSRMESVGYKDAKYFSQQFMKVVGVKPAEYRKLYY